MPCARASLRYSFSFRSYFRLFRSTLGTESRPGAHRALSSRRPLSLSCVNDAVSASAERNGRQDSSSSFSSSRHAAVAIALSPLSFETRALSRRRCTKASRSAVQVITSRLRRNFSPRRLAMHAARGARKTLRYWYVREEKVRALRCFNCLIASSRGLLSPGRAREMRICTDNKGDWNSRNVYVSTLY